MKKNSAPEYLPSRLVQGNSRWYIVFYVFNELTEKQERFRLTFNLNRIKDVKKRIERGEELVDKINWWLHQGKPIQKFAEHKVPASALLSDPKDELFYTNVIEAIDYILKLKSHTTRKDTLRSYKSTVKFFISFLKRYRWDRLNIGEVTRRHAASYMDSCLVDRELGSYAYNNNLRYMRAIFNELKRKEYVDNNPFGELPYMEKTEKKRRAFSKQEARIVIKAIRKDSQLLFYGLLFEYCCFLRPSEIVKLTGGDIDIDQGIITIPSSKGKTKKTRYATIPNAFLDYFDKSFFKKIPRHAYIFGAGFIPAQSKPCNNNTMGKRHKRILERLKNEGILKDISGLQWYSWKDTGITDALENVAILAVQDQAGHHSPEMTLKYRHKKKINRALQDGFKNEII